IEIELGKGLAVIEACRKLGITEPTYDRWKNEDGGLRVEQAKRLKGLEQEHARLKRLVAAGTCYARPDAEKRCAMRRPRAWSPSAGRREWSGTAGLPSRLCPPKWMTRAACGHGSSGWPTSMAAT